MKLKQIVRSAVAGMTLATPRWALACAACAGRSDDAVARGLNAAIFTLLAVLLVVLGGFAGALVHFIRRAAHGPSAISSGPEGTAS